MSNIANLRLIPIAAIGAIVLCAAAYFSMSEIHHLSMAEAHKTLARVPPPAMVLGLYAQDSETAFVSSMPVQGKVTLLPRPEEDSVEHKFTIDALDPRRVVWTFTRDDDAVVTYVATLTPVAGRFTRISVAMTVVPDDTNDQTAKFATRNQQIKNFYLRAMKEQIAAVLENRDFNFTSFAAELLAATTANVAKIQDNVRDALLKDAERTREYEGKPFTSSGDAR